MFALSFIAFVNVFGDQVGDGWAGADKFQHVAVGIADEDRLGPSKLAAACDGNAVFADEGFGRFGVLHLDSKMGNAGILWLFVHQNVFARPCRRGPEQIDIDARRMQHYQRMALVVAAVSNHLKAKELIERDRILAVADANADVVKVRYIKHVFDLSLSLARRYACDMNNASVEKIASPVHLDHMPSADRMREFLEVVRAGSISEGARVLGLPRATLSRRMSGLEADLGIRLIHRRTTRLALTHAGEELRQRAQRIVADTEAAWDSVRRLDDTPRGLLRVSVTGPYFLRLFTQFLCDFPEVRLEVLSSTRHVDLLAESVDVAMRIGEVKDQDLIARRVHSDRLIAVASPAYLERRGTPKTASDLASHDCIVGFAGEWTPNIRWPLLNGGQVNVRGRLSANEIDLIREAAQVGLGLALLASAIVVEDIEGGRLVPVLTREVGAEIPISLVYADREFVDPKIREFVDRAALIIRAEMPKPYAGLAQFEDA